MNITCEKTRIFKSKEFDNYFTSVSHKNENGTYDNCYINVRFKNDNRPTIEDYKDIKIKSGFLTCYKANDKTYLIIQVLEYEIL